MTHFSPPSGVVGTRRLQLSLKSLLFLMAAVGIVLGAAHLVKRYGEFLEVHPCRVGELVQINARVIRFFGPKTLFWKVLVTDAEGESDHIVSRKACRSWLFAYSIDVEFDLGGYSPPESGSSADFALWKYVPPEPGEYLVTLRQVNEPNERALSAKLVVLPRR